MLRQASFDPSTGDISSNILGLFNDRNQSGKATPLEIESQITNELIKVLQSGVRFRVMIDALDECDKPMDLLAALEEVYNNALGKLEILVTSRHEVDVMKIDAFNNCHQINLNTSITREDMKKFISLEVRGAKKHARLLGGKYPDLEERLVDVLNKKAVGMYVLCIIYYHSFANIII